MSPEPITILIVDDETLVRRVLGDALSQTGYRIKLAGSGAEALEYMRHNQPDLMLLDLQLGDTDGVEVMRSVRARWPGLPIIILTAHGSLSSAIEAVRHDAADYLLKPIGVDALRTRVSEVLSLRRVTTERQERIRTMYEQLQALARDEGLLDAAEAPASAPGFQAGPLSLDVAQHMVRMHGQSIDVTPTEFAILQELVRQPGAVVPCVQMIQSFQHANLDEDEARQVLRPHIMRLRRKIESDPQRPIYIQSVRGVGYRWGTAQDMPSDD